MRIDYELQVKGIITRLVPVELEGTEKQIAWALEIRSKAARILFNNEVMYEQYEEVNLLPGRKNEMRSRPVSSIITALRSKESIKEYFDNMKKNNLPESRFESAVKSMNDALDRFERYAEIMSNTSAKFWIDNRDNQEKNYMFKAFKEYVNTGVKKF